MAHSSSEPIHPPDRLIAALVEARDTAGISQSELARRSGIRQPEISRLEAGRLDPRLSTLRRYADAIGVDIRVPELSQGEQQLYGRSRYWRAPIGTPCVVCAVSDVQLYRDHCHVHGWIRGLVCRRCNGMMSVVDAGSIPRGSKMTAAGITADDLVAHAARCQSCPPLTVEALSQVRDRRESRSYYSAEWELRRRDPDIELDWANLRAIDREEMRQLPVTLCWSEAAAALGVTNEAAADEIRATYDTESNRAALQGLPAIFVGAGRFVVPLYPLLRKLGRHDLTTNWPAIPGGKP
jgi:DNA-binding XRE family transcriptional regulator